MGDWEVGKITVVQYDGDSKKFSEDMAKAWGKAQGTVRNTNKIRIFQFNFRNQRRLIGHMLCRKQQLINSKGWRNVKTNKRQLVSLLLGVCMLGVSAVGGHGPWAGGGTRPRQTLCPLPNGQGRGDEGQALQCDETWKIATASGTFYFENGDETGGTTGFSSAFDQDGNDWIGADNEQPGFNTVPGAKGLGPQDARLPQVHGRRPNLKRPPRRRVPRRVGWNTDGKEVAFKDKLEGDHLIMRSFNATNEAEYHFFPSHAAIKIIKMGSPFAFHFQGLIGGEPELFPKDYYVLKDGKKRDVDADAGIRACPRSSRIRNGHPRSSIMVDSEMRKRRRSSTWAAKNLAPATYADEGWLARGPAPDKLLNIQIFSFGRNNDKHSLTRD